MKSIRIIILLIVIIQIVQKVSSSEKKCVPYPFILPGRYNKSLGGDPMMEKLAKVSWQCDDGSINIYRGEASDFAKKYFKYDLLVRTLPQ